MPDFGCKMDKDEFTRRWRRMKTPNERCRFLAEELNSELGSFNSYRNQLPTIRSNSLAFLEEYAYMKNNNQNAYLTEKVMFGSNNMPNVRNDKSSIVNKIIEEMTNVPALIEGFNPSTSQLLKTTENGNVKSQKAPASLSESKPQKQELYTRLPVINEFSSETLNFQSHSTSKPYISTDPASKTLLKPQKSPHDNHQTMPPVSNQKHKLDGSMPTRPAKQACLESSQAIHSAPIKAEAPALSPLPTRNQRPTGALSQPNSKHQNTKSGLFPCNFPKYAIGEYVGYRIKASSEKNSTLPDSVVSINIKKMPSVKKIMDLVKNCIRHGPQTEKLKSSDLICALYLAGLMLYAVHKSPPVGVNDLLREVLSILSTIRSMFLDSKSPCSQSRNHYIISNMMYLAESHLCERLYLNTLEGAYKRRQFMEQCRPFFDNFNTNDELVTANFDNVFKEKEHQALLLEFCAKDKVDIPKLYYQLLLENSQHGMLHERHIYSRRLAKQQMENLESVLWKRLTVDMKFRLNDNSCVEIADSIFTLVYWMYINDKV